jgi:glucose/arabinose dehydrogenase
MRGKGSRGFRQRRCALVAATLAAALVSSGPATAATPIPGFEERVVAGGFTYALDMDFAPDGRIFVVEKGGRLYAINPNGSKQLVLSIAAHVNEAVDRGLTGVAVDSSFASNHYVYLLYTYDLSGTDNQAPRTSRLTRIVVNANNTVVNPRLPETTVVGTWQPALNEACPAPSNLVDCIPADGNSHVNGTVRSAPDGTLYLGTGDAMYAATNSPDELRPLNETSYAGKILHVDRNGQGLPGHRFCPTDTTLTHACTKVFAMGFRNPFRFSLRGDGQTLFAGDVGEKLYEEVDQVVSGGSYGWPCYEGPTRNPYLTGRPQCQTRFQREGTASAEKAPIYSYPNGDSGAAVILGGEYMADAYPAAYRGSVFVGDFVQGWVSRLTLDNAVNVTGIQPFASDWLGVALRTGPDGLMYSANFWSISKFVPIAGNRSPVAAISADPIAGLAPLDVHFDAGGSTDPDGDTLAYTWDFGDGTPPAVGVTAAHTYTANGNHTASVTVTDPSGASATASVLITVGNRLPVITVASPADGGLYRDGQAVALSATANDPEDGDLGDSAIRWHITLQHNTHQHIFGEITGRQGSFTPLTDHDADSYYLIDVTATDSGGLSATRHLQINPETVAINIGTDPAAPADVFYGGASFAAPFSARTAIGYMTSVAAPETLVSGGQTLVFSSWSDSGSRVHDLTVPTHDVSLVAHYAADTVPPETTITSGPDATTDDHTPTFTFVADEAVRRFECSVDTAAFAWCESPYTTPKLVGHAKQHTFRVRAIDLAGNYDATAAKSTFVVVG